MNTIKINKHDNHLKFKKSNLVLIQYLSIKYYSNILIYVFGIILPIILLIIFSTFLKINYYNGLDFLNRLKNLNINNHPFPESIRYFAQQYVYTTNFIIVGISLIPGLIIGTIGTIFLYGSARSNKFSKIYSVLNISPEKYFLTNFLIYLFNELIIQNTILLCYNFIVIQHTIQSPSLMFSAAEYFSFVFIGIYALIFNYIIGITFCLISEKFLIVISVGFIYFIVTILISNMAIPAFYYMNNNTNSNPNDPAVLKWLQYLTFSGSAQRLNSIVIYNHWEPWFSKNWPVVVLKNHDYIYPQWDVVAHTDWKTDWLSFISPLVQISICIVLICKFINWRYHRNTNTLGTNFKINHLNYQFHQNIDNSQIKKELETRVIRLKKELEEVQAELKKYS